MNRNVAFFFDFLLILNSELLDKRQRSYGLTKCLVIQLSFLTFLDGQMDSENKYTPSQIPLKEF